MINAALAAATTNERGTRERFTGASWDVVVPHYPD
jgi:hypothetical protein